MHIHTIRKFLDIPEFKVARIILYTDTTIRILIEPYKRKKFVCSGCDSVLNEGYHSSKEAPVEDLALGEKRVWLHVVKRRFFCPKCSCIRTEKINWLKPRARVTDRLAKRVNRLTAITTNQEAGWFMGMDDEKVYRIDKEILEEKAKELLVPPPAAVNISVDEVSYRKYHRYLTNVIDTDKKLLIWNDKGRKAEVLNRYYEGIGKENCAKMESVALDGARTYISSTSQYAKNALIVYDKFHVMQKLNKAIDAVRKEELYKARKINDEGTISLINCRQRFVLLKNKNKLTDKQAGHLKRLCEINEPIYKAMLLKESFLEVYEQENLEDAEECLKNWIREASASSLDAFKALAFSFLDKMAYILNWFKRKISSAISEGFNNKIKRLKRMAYGYKDIEYFKLKIHQHCGLLNPRLST